MSRWSWSGVVGFEAQETPGGGIKMKTSVAVNSLGIGLILLNTAALKAAIVDIRYDLSGGNVYQYTVYNNSLPALTDFIVYFAEPTGPGEYRNLGATVRNQPADWTGLPVEPSAISLNGYVEWYTADAGIGSGSSLGGFEVSFDTFGLSAPGSQWFEVYDGSFAKVADGWTTPVPEPSAFALVTLLGAGLWVAGFRVRQTLQGNRETTRDA